MSCIKSDSCLNSGNYLEEYVGYRPCDDIVSIEKFDEILASSDVCLWNYPLTEIDHIIENDISVILVKFLDDYDGYEYRFCEIPKEA